MVLEGLAEQFAICFSDSIVLTIDVSIVCILFELFSHWRILDSTDEILYIHSLTIICVFDDRLLMNILRDVN